MVIEGLSNEIAALACQDKGCERLMTVPQQGSRAAEERYELAPF
jgi:hypothetical protein